MVIPGFCLLIVCQFRRLDLDHTQLKEDSFQLKEQSERWQREYLRVEKDNRKWQGHYAQADRERGDLAERLEQQVGLGLIMIPMSNARHYRANVLRLIRPHRPRNPLLPRMRSGMPQNLRVNPPDPLT